jgi:hypothetical protein
MYRFALQDLQLDIFPVSVEGTKVGNRSAELGERTLTIFTLSCKYLVWFLACGTSSVTYDSSFAHILVLHFIPEGLDLLVDQSGSLQVSLSSNSTLGNRCAYKHVPQRFSIVP